MTGGILVFSRCDAFYHGPVVGTMLWTHKRRIPVDCVRAADRLGSLAIVYIRKGGISSTCVGERTGCAVDTFY